MHPKTPMPSRPPGARGSLRPLGAVPSSPPIAPSVALGGAGEPGPGAREQLERAITFARRAARFWWLVAAGLGLGVLGCVVFLLLFKPRYRSETVILYREGIRSSVLGDQPGAGVDRNIGNRLRELLLARPRLEKVIDEFTLYRDIIAKRGMIDAVEEFRLKTSFKARSVDTFAIAFEGSSPEEVQAVTARLANELVDEDSRLRLERARGTKDFLDAEKRRTEDDLKRRETALARFLAEHPEFAFELTQSQGASIRAQQRGEALAASGGGGGSAREALLRQVPRIKKRIADIDAGVKSPAAVDPALAAAKSAAAAELGSARRALAQAEAAYTEQHPDVRAAQARVQAADAQLARADEAIASATPVPAAPAGSSEKEALEAQLRKIEGEIASQRASESKSQAKAASSTEVTSTSNRIVALETEWTRLIRDVSEARLRNEQLEANYFKAQISASSESGGFASQLAIIDPAYKPVRPFTPGRGRFVAGILAVGSVLGGLCAALFGVLDDRIYVAGDVRFAPVLAVVPRPARRGRRRRDG
jgi:uncharacterized protein involved in exopolysaccharide biosynthesis